MPSDPTELLFVCLICGVLQSYLNHLPILLLTMHGAHITSSHKYPLTQRKPPADHSFPSAALIFSTISKSMPRSVYNKPFKQLSISRNYIHIRWQQLLHPIPTISLDKMVLETYKYSHRVFGVFFTLEYELALNHHNCYEDNKNKNE